MYFSQKIFLNDDQLILTTDKEAYIEDHAQAKAYITFYGASLQSFTRALSQLEKPGASGVIIEDASAEALLDQLHAMYRVIDAGGGLVANEQGEILMIFRRGKWDLPKGKLDAGEDIAACALREVQEETGLKHVTLGQKICDTYHIYTERNDQILKRTAWYRMKGTLADKLKPQKEEQILEAKWVGRADIPSLAANTYEAIREVLRLGVPEPG